MPIWKSEAALKCRSCRKRPVCAAGAHHQSGRDTITPRGKIHPVKHMISDLLWGMRGLAIIIVAVVALSAMAGGHQPHFVPRPTGPMPAVNVP
jgi:hypothetical protein